MLRTLAMSALVWAAALTSGCATISDGRLEAAPIAAQDGQLVRNTAHDLNTTLRTALKGAPGVTDNILARPRGISNEQEAARLVLLAELKLKEPDARIVRNTIAHQLIAASNQNCKIYMQNIRANQAGARTASDVLSTGTALAGSISEPPRTASLLSALSGLFTGVGASIDRNIYAETGAELIAEAVFTSRDGDRRVIEDKLQTRSAAQYSISNAVADIYNFHGRCSILGGLMEMREAITTRELAVRAARVGRMQAARDAAPVSAEALAAVLSMLSPNTAEQPPTRVAIATIAPPSDADDLVAQETDGLGCLRALKDAAKAADESPEKTEFYKNLKDNTLSSYENCKDTKTWTGALRPFVVQTFKSHKGDIPQGNSDAAAAGLMKVELAYKAKAAARIARNKEVRTFALTQVRTLGELDRPAAEMAEAVKLAAGDEFKDDPLLKQLQAIAMAARDQKGDGLADLLWFVATEYAESSARPSL